MPASMRPPAATAALLAFGLFVSGCAGDHATRPADMQTDEPTVTLLTYRCESGAMIRATYPTDAIALVRYRGQTRQMRVARAASGVRYVDDGLQWWTKGTGAGATAVLSERADGGTALERCEEIEARDNA